MKQDITGTIQKFPAQPSRNPIWNTVHSTNNFHVEPSAELPFLHRVKKAIFGYNDPLTCNFAIDEESLFFPLGSNKNLWIYHFY